MSPNTCTHCKATPLDWGQRGDGEAQQDPETGLPYCGIQCLERAAIHNAAETAQARAMASNDIAFKTIARALHIIADAHTPTPDLSAFREQL
jgi:hypothetical protein